MVIVANRFQSVLQWVSGMIEYPLQFCHSILTLLLEQIEQSLFQLSLIQSDSLQLLAPINRALTHFFPGLFPHSHFIVLVISFVVI